eukprot:5867102-Prymnesium_polylepis.1
MGKYQKRRGGADVWLRADELIHHSGTELAAARDSAKAAAVEASQVAVEEELTDGGHEVGDKVFVHALGPDGETAWYQAVVLGIRKRFPPLKVMYIKTHPGGETGPLVLPSPVTAHVPATAVRKDAPA